MFHKLNFCTRYSATLVGCDYYVEQYNRPVDDTWWGEGELMVRMNPGSSYTTRSRHLHSGWLSDSAG